MYRKQIIKEDDAYIVGEDKYIVAGGKVLGQYTSSGIKLNKGNMPTWITERPTVEAVKSAVKVEEFAAEGKAKFDAIVAETQEKTVEVRKKRRPVKQVPVEIKPIHEMF